MKKIVISTSDLKRLLELAAQYPFAVIDSNDNTDGESVWHCDVEFYDEPGDENPIELFSFDKAPTEREVYNKLSEQYDKEDLKDIADMMDVVLTDEQLDFAYAEYNERESMEYPKRDTMENIIRNIKEEHE